MATEGKRMVRSSSSRARGAAVREKGQISTTSSHKSKGETEYSQETEEKQSLGTTTFPPGVEPAFVRVAAGGTYNLGDYESLRIDVSVTLPCRVEQIEKTYKKASEFVADKLGEEEMLWMPKRSGKR